MSNDQQSSQNQENSKTDISKITKQDLADPSRWERSFIEKVVAHYLREQRSTRTWKIVLRMIWASIFASIVIFFYLQEFTSIDTAVTSNSRGSSKSSDHYAFIKYEGVINEKNVEQFLNSFKNAVENSNSKAVFIKASSGGGSVSYSNILYDEITKLKTKNDKKVYIFVDDVCASGCYYGFSAADDIYVNRTAIVGSIGVIEQGLNYSQLLNKLGIKNSTMTAGRLKAFGDPASPENEEVKAYRQHLLDYLHQIFIQDVKKARGDRIKEDKDPDIFSGKVWVGEEAFEVGLIDGIKNMDEFIEELTNEGEEKLPVVDYSPNKDPLERFLGFLPGANINNILENKEGYIY